MTWPATIQSSSAGGVRVMLVPSAEILACACSDDRFIAACVTGLSKVVGASGSLLAHFSSAEFELKENASLSPASGSNVKFEIWEVIAVRSTVDTLLGEATGASLTLVMARF